MTTATVTPINTRQAPQGRLEKFMARRIAGAMSAAAPNQQFMRYVQNPIWNFLCDKYFRVEIDGWHRIPDEPSLLIGIHSGGSLTMDAWTLVHSWYRRFEGRRILNGTAHDVLMAAPLLGDYFKALGVIPASRKGVTDALAAGHDVVVWPGGEQDAMRNWRQRDKAILAGRKGFVRQAIRSGVPIVPVATVGGHDTVFVLSEGRFIARWTGLGKRLRGATIPIIAGFPFPLAVEILPASAVAGQDPHRVPRSGLRRYRPGARRRHRVRGQDLPGSTKRDPGRDGPAGQARQLPGVRVSCDAPAHRS